MNPPEIGTKAKIAALCAAVLMASLVSVAPLPGQTSNLNAPGRVEAAGPAMSIGVAVGGIVDKVLVREGDRVRAAQTLVTLDCRPTQADVRAREAQLAAAQATFDRYRNGSRADEIAVGEAVVRYAQARADEAAKALGRADAMQEGVTITTARLLEVQRDARIAAAQLEEARSKLSLLRAGSREEDIRHAQALRDTAAAQLEASRARLDQCTIHAPADGTVLDMLVNPGQFVSFAVPQPLLHIVPDGPLRVRAEVDVRDRARICIAQSATVTADAALPAASARKWPRSARLPVRAGSPRPRPPLKPAKLMRTTWWP